MGSNIAMDLIFVILYGYVFTWKIDQIKVNFFKTIVNINEFNI